MTSVVIAHAPEDALPARALAQKLAQMGLQPVVELPVGERLRSAMQGASAAVALWSPRSISEPSFVLDVVRVPKVIHARMQNAPIPHEFSTERSIDLTGWRGEDNFPAWRELATVIAQTVGAAAPPAPPPPPPAPAPQAAGGFFQPGAPPQQAPQRAQPQEPVREPPAAPTFRETPAATQPEPEAVREPPAHLRPVPDSAPNPDHDPFPQSAPGAFPQTAPHGEGGPAVLAAPDFESDDRDFTPPSEPKSGGKAGLFIGVAIAAAALIGGGYWYMTSNGADPALATAWENIDINDPAALRNFIAASTGSLREQAQDALAALEENQFDAARDADSIEAYEAFLADFPNSDHSLQARGRIAELRQSRPQTEDAEDGAVDEVALTEDAPAEEETLTHEETPFGGESPEAPEEPDSAFGSPTFGARPFGSEPGDATAPSPGASPAPVAPTPVPLGTRPQPSQGGQSNAPSTSGPTALSPPPASSSPSTGPQSLSPPPSSGPASGEEPAPE